jgi:hypothetical protein
VGLAQRAQPARPNETPSLICGIPQYNDAKEKNTMTTPTDSTEPVDPTEPTPQTPEETRREMRRRFDALNTEAESGHQQRRDASNLSVSEENKRWLRPQDAPALDKDESSEDQPD